MATRLLLAVSLVVLLLSLSLALGGQPPAAPEIHCKHFLYGYPLGAPATNDLVIRDIYALSSNDQTKLADWVAYRLDRDTVEGDVETTRKWQADPWLAPDETLEPPDYNGASAALSVDRGHQAPLGSFKGTDNWADTNYLSNITPQKSALNQGPWERLEEDERTLAKDDNVLYVMTGPLYEAQMPPLPHADEPNTIPSGYWKVIVLAPDAGPDSLVAASFIFTQTTPRNSPVLDHLTTIDEVEARSHLDLLSALPDGTEASVESNDFHDWAAENFQ